ncbi:MAG: hypothetical protein WCI22_00165 [Actinomycetota bacterium]
MGRLVAVLSMAAGLLVAAAPTTAPTAMAKGKDSSSVASACGSASASLPGSCVTGTLAAHMIIYGTSARPANWTVTLSSPDCPVVRSIISLEALVPGKGGSATFSGLPVYVDMSKRALCHYSLVETSVAGWNSRFIPPFDFTLPENSTTIITLENRDLGAIPTTTTPSVDQRPPTPSTTAPPAPPVLRKHLPFTGSGGLPGELRIGLTLIGLGLLLRLVRRYGAVR